MMRQMAGVDADSGQMALPAPPGATAGANSTNLTTELPPPTPTLFKEVFVGLDDEAVDTTLDPGTTYVYRVQAWNAIGHSEWTR